MQGFYAGARKLVLRSVQKGPIGSGVHMTSDHLLRSHAAAEMVTVSLRGARIVDLCSQSWIIGGQKTQVKRNVNTRAVLSRIGKVADLTTFLTHQHRAVYGRSRHESWSCLSHGVKMGCFQMRNLRPESARGSVIDRKWTSKRSPKVVRGTEDARPSASPTPCPKRKKKVPSIGYFFDFSRCRNRPSTSW